MTPSAHDVAEWVDEIASGDHSPSPEVFTTIRTGALFPRATSGFLAHGFVEVDRLALLERPLLDPAGRRPPVPTGTALHRLRDRDLDVAASLDASAFEPTWSNDASSLGDIIDATPQSRGCIVVDTELRSRWSNSVDPANALGFSITGRAGHTGYLQRLAVRPDARRRGIAQLLIDDACRWFTQRGANRVMVNTGTANRGALALYERCGFTRSTNELVVLELDISGHGRGRRT